MKFRTEAQRNIRALPKNNLKKLDCLPNNLKKFRLFWKQSKNSDCFRNTRKNSDSFCAQRNKKIIYYDTHPRQWRSFLEAVADHFDRFFHDCVDYQVVPSLLGVFGSYWASLSFILPFSVSSWILNKNKYKLKNLGIENSGLLNEIWTPN